MLNTQIGIKQIAQYSIIGIPTKTSAKMQCWAANSGGNTSMQKQIYKTDAYNFKKKF